MGAQWEAGCPHCSFWADNFNGIDIHLTHRDVSFVVVLYAPLPKPDAFKSAWHSTIHSIRDRVAGQGWDAS
ncbi:MAG: DUF899 family protein [Deltaproteobacteria bacterium]|nr:DUF899 family protein [Deltaproteobacteria bacterium]